MARTRSWPASLLAGAVVLLLPGCTGERMPAVPTTRVPAPVTPGRSPTPTSPSPSATLPGQVTVTPPPSPEAVGLLADALRSVRRARSVHAVGTVNHDGVPTTFEVVGTRDGRLLAGTVAVGSDPVLEVRRVEGRTYLRRRSPVGVPPDPFVLDEGKGDVTALPTAGRLLAALEHTLQELPPGPVTPTLFASREAWLLTAPGSTRLVVAKDPPGQVLQLSVGAGRDAGTIAFDAWDAEVHPESPPASGVAQGAAP